MLPSEGVRMPRYVITSVFELGAGKQPLGADVLGQAWGMGHRFSYSDGRMLTLVAEVTAPDTPAAFEALLSRAEMVWQDLGHGPLGTAVTVRIQAGVDPQPVPAGLPPADTGTGRPRRGRVARVLRYVNPLERVLDDVGLPWRDDEDPPDDGGLAGVREPRRPKPAPPGLHAVRDLPDAQDLPDAV
jgi:hypothetical protein